MLQTSIDPLQFSRALNVSEESRQENNETAGSESRGPINYEGA